MGYGFISIDQVLSGYIPQKKDHLLVLGYPASKMKVDTVRKLIHETPFLYRTIAVLQKDTEKDYPREFNILTSYPRKSLINRQTEQTTQGPKPNGISGSGLWLIQYAEREISSLLLVGISFEYHENRSIFAATRIDLFLDVIRQVFDSTVPNYGIRADLG